MKRVSIAMLFVAASMLAGCGGSGASSGNSGGGGGQATTATFKLHLSWNPGATRGIESDANSIIVRVRETPFSEPINTFTINRPALVDPVQVFESPVAIQKGKYSIELEAKELTNGGGETLAYVFGSKQLVPGSDNKISVALGGTPVAAKMLTPSIWRFAQNQTKARIIFERGTADSWQLSPLDTAQVVPGGAARLDPDGTITLFENRAVNFLFPGVVKDVSVIPYNVPKYAPDLSTTAPWPTARCNYQRNSRTTSPGMRTMPISETILTAGRTNNIPMTLDADKRLSVRNNDKLYFLDTVSKTISDLYFATAVTYAANGEIYLSGEYNYKLRQNLNSVIPAEIAPTYTLSEFATVFDNFFSGPGGDFNRFDLSRNAQTISFSKLTSDGIGLGTNQLFFPNSAAIKFPNETILGSDDTNIYTSSQGSNAVIYDMATFSRRETNQFLSSPIVFDPYVLSTSNSSFQLVDLKTLQRKWNFFINGFSNSYIASTTDGTIYVRASNTIYALDESTGLTLWSVTPSSNIISSNGVIDSDGTLFVGLTNGILKLSPAPPSTKLNK